MSDAVWKSRTGKQDSGAMSSGLGQSHPPHVMPGVPAPESSMRQVVVLSSSQSSLDEAQPQGVV